MRSEWGQVVIKMGHFSSLPTNHQSYSDKNPDYSNVVVVPKGLCLIFPVE